MVARHTRRTGWHAASGCVCIDCGTHYLFTNAYKGNYCPDCHETWVARQRGDAPSTRSPPRFGPSSHRSDNFDESDDLVDNSDKDGE